MKQKRQFKSFLLLLLALILLAGMLDPAGLQAANAGQLQETSEETGANLQETSEETGANLQEEGAQPVADAGETASVKPAGPTKPVVKKAKVGPVKMKSAATSGKASVIIRWHPVSGAKAYRLYGRKKGSTKWKLLAETKKTAYRYHSNSGKLKLNWASSYEFGVIAKDAVGSTIQPPNIRSVKKLSMKPAKVSKLSVKKSKSKKKLLLKWKKTSGASGYYLYRKTALNGKWKRIARVPAGKNHYYDADVKWTHRYYYKVRAYWKTGKKTCLSPSGKTVRYVSKNARKSSQKIKWNSKWKYAGNSRIHKDTATLYRAKGKKRKGIIVAINAGHGTRGGGSVKTLCHPDGSAKVTGGSTPRGALRAPAVSEGTSLGRTSEAAATLTLAKIVKKKLLSRGYDVLMIREDEDVQLDNIARTVMANNCADCQLSLHYDSTSGNKGFFYAGVPNISSYRSMEPVASNWKRHEKLGKAIVDGEKKNHVKICGSGRSPIDLTQTSYAEIPSLLLEVGDKGSSRSEAALNGIAKGIADGLDIYYKQ